MADSRMYPNNPQPMSRQLEPNAQGKNPLTCLDDIQGKVGGTDAQRSSRGYLRALPVQRLSAQDVRSEGENLACSGV